MLSLLFSNPPSYRCQPAPWKLALHLGDRMTLLGDARQMKDERGSDGVARAGHGLGQFAPGERWRGEQSEC